MSCLRPPAGPSARGRASAQSDGDGGRHPCPRCRASLAGAEQGVRGVAEVHAPFIGVLRGDFPWLPTSVENPVPRRGVPTADGAPEPG